MKTLQLVIFLLAFNSIQAQTDSPAKIYLKHYFNMYVPIQKDMWAFSVAVARDKDNSTIESKRIELLNTLSHYQRVVKGSPNFNKDSTLRLSVYNWLTECKNLFQKDYAEIMEHKPNAKNSIETMQRYLLLKETSSSKLQKANENLDNASEIFAEYHSLKIVEEETRIGNRIKRINSAFKYYDNIYLLFFEAYTHEARFNEAVNSQDFQKVKTEVELLKKITESSIKKLLATDKYEDDPFLKFAALNILNSYKTTANSYGEQVLEFYLLQDNIAQSKKNIMAKEPEERTQKEISNYNLLITKRKEMIPKFNENTQLFNEIRRRELNDWNAAVEDFIRKNAL